MHRPLAPSVLLARSKLSRAGLAEAGEDATGTRFAPSGVGPAHSSAAGSTRDADPVPWISRCIACRSRTETDPALQPPEHHGTGISAANASQRTHPPVLRGRPGEALLAGYDARGAACGRSSCAGGCIVLQKARPAQRGIFYARCAPANAQAEFEADHTGAWERAHATPRAPRMRPTTVAPSAGRYLCSFRKHIHVAVAPPKPLASARHGVGLEFRFARAATHCTGALTRAARPTGNGAATLERVNSAVPLPSRRVGICGYTRPF